MTTVHCVAHLKSFVFCFVRNLCIFVCCVKIGFSKTIVYFQQTKCSRSFLYLWLLSYSVIYHTDRIYFVFAFDKKKKKCYYRWIEWVPRICLMSFSKCILFIRLVVRVVALISHTIPARLWHQSEIITSKWRERRTFIIIY